MPGPNKPGCLDLSVEDFAGGLGLLTWQGGSPKWPLPTQRALPRCPSGAVAQLGERLVRNEEVRGSIPLGSTSLRGCAASAGKPTQQANLKRSCEGCSPQHSSAK